MSQLSPTQADTLYPDSDGNPMADNTEQFQWIVVIKENLELLFTNLPDVFVAGDLLWYPVEGNAKIRTAPDAMVVFGRPKGRRGSYQQWREDGIAPQVVFEVLSPGNRKVEMERKLLFYDRYGVAEYYTYDPDSNELEGWLRSDGYLDVLTVMNNWVSPRLGIRFVPSDDTLQILRPDGKPFLTFVELGQRLEQEQQRAEAEQQRAETERQRAETLEDLLQRYRDRFGELPEQP
jgi:Uma2 family endonuclease